MALDVSGILTNAGASLIGAWLGAVLAVRKLRREKAFERQLQWHEDIADNLVRMASSLNRLKSGRFKGPRLSGELNDLEREIDRFAILGQKASHYATRASLRRITVLMTTMRDRMVELPLSGDVSTDLHAHTIAISDLLEPVKAASQGIASDVRRHLGLPPARSWWQRLRRARKESLPAG